MPKPILISISPNLKTSDFFLSLKNIFKPFSWKKGTANHLLLTKLTKLLNQKHGWIFNAGRNALQVGLEALELKSSDEVLCQAFTCVAVPNAIKWAGAKPIYVDSIKNGFNLNIQDLKTKITKNSKALIIQHTFGNPDKIIKIQALCKKHNLILIEDCAHSLGVKYKNKPLGSFGDLTMLSFGRDKVISSVFGGALLTSNAKLAKKIQNHYQELSYPSFFWIIKQLLHPIITYLVKPVYFIFGKHVLFVYQKSGLLSWPVTNKEKNSQPSLPIRKLPNALAILALHQLKKLTNLNQQRRKIVKLYKNSKFGTLNYLLRYPVLVNNPRHLIKKAKKQHILLGDWYRPVIAPQGVKLNLIDYTKGSCPNAESVSKKIVNLPTLINKNQAQQIIKLVNDHS